MEDLFFSRINENIEKTIKLDLKDEKIISELSKDSRIPASKISKIVRLSKEGTSYRIKRLMSNQIICPVPFFDVRQFGYSTYHVFIITGEKESEKEEMIEELKNHKNTKMILEYSDRWDLEWVVVAKNVQEFDDIVTDITKKYYDIIVEKQKFEIIFGLKSTQYPVVSKSHNVLESKKLTNYKLDETNYQLIEELIKNARASICQIAGVLKISPDATIYRIRKMQEEGHIREFSIMPNFSLLDMHLSTLCIDLRTFTHEHEMKFKEYISQKPEIIRAVKVLGDWDLMLHVVTRNVSELYKISKELQKMFSDIIISYQSWGTFKEHYYTPLPRVILENRK